LLWLLALRKKKLQLLLLSQSLRPQLLQLQQKHQQLLPLKPLRLLLTLLRPLLTLLLPHRLLLRPLLTLPLRPLSNFSFAEKKSRPSGRLFFVCTSRRGPVLHGLIGKGARCLTRFVGQTPVPLLPAPRPPRSDPNDKSDHRLAQT
jgi:hypothetical protein